MSYARRGMKGTEMRSKEKNRFKCLLLAACLLTGSSIWADDESNAPRPVPLTRPAMKQLLEDVKFRTPRIPLPELTEVDREKLGDQFDNYESRVRHHYLNGIELPRPTVPQTATIDPGKPSAAPAMAAREQDPSFTLDNVFKVELFWIVSRVNNCQYCIGHQESKLLGAGLSEDQIAALDGDWTDFQPAKRVAFAFARKFTYQPHLLNDGDIAGLSAHYSDSQILEMIFSMSGNNSINRWKEAIGVPQRKDEGGYSRLATRSSGSSEASQEDLKFPRGSYLTPTSSAYMKKISQVAVIDVDSKSDSSTCTAISKRPPLESREEVEKSLAKARTRKSRLALVSEELARQAIPGCSSTVGELPHWVRLIANFPKAGASRFDGIQAAGEKGDLSPLLKSQLSWILARQDRAWYSLGQAKMRLQKLGQSDDQIYALDGNCEHLSERDRALFRLAKQLGMSPVVLTDEDVASAVKWAGARDVVQTISFTTSRASFNRLTESAGLPLD